MEYDINKLFAVLRGFLPGFASENWCSLQFTSDTSFVPDQTDYSFRKQYSSLMGKQGGDYRPGNVLDILLNKNEQTYFVSLFFDTEARTVQFRLVRLAQPTTQPLSEAFYRLGQIQSSDDRVLDEGEIAFGDDYVLTANRITGWMRFQIEHDTTGQS